MGLFSFHKKSETHKKTSGESSSNLTVPSEIESHLNEIGRQSTFIHIWIDKNPALYNSIFVGISADKRAGALIDALMPKVGNDYIKKSKKIKISYIFEGKQYNFESKFLEIIKDKYESIKILIPQVINKIEHRKFVRVKLTAIAQLMVCVENSRNKRIVEDISAGGMAFYTSHIFREGHILSKVSIVLPPGGHEINARAEVRRFIKDVGPSYESRHKCCAKFLDLNKSQTELIIKFVTDREREILRGKVI